MAVWTGQEPEWQLAQDLVVTLFWRSQVLDATLDDLTRYGYHVVDLDCDCTENDFHNKIAQALCFPSYYGRSLAALNDCLSDVAARDYGVPPAATGLVVALRHVDRLELCHELVEAFWFQSMRAALYGNRMLTLAQADDLCFGHVLGGPSMRLGQYSASEWPDSKREPW